MEVEYNEEKYLPHDLITHNILTRLPIKPLIQFKLVSKKWYSSISSPHFAQTHFKFHHPSPSQSLLIKSNNKFHVLSYENGVDLVNFEVDFGVGDENVVLVGTCNGLVCFGSVSGLLFVVWNPITREFRKYLGPDVSSFSTQGWMVTWGFGYVSSLDEYKIVRICKEVKGESIRVHVFSIKSNEWRRIDEDDSFDSSHDYSELRNTKNLYRLPGVLVNETLYWMGGVPPNLEGSERKIMCLDLAREVFNTFPHLELSTPSRWITGEECIDEYLCVVQGCLAKYGRLIRNGIGVITVLRSPEDTEQIVLSRDVVSSTCKNVIGCGSSDVIFTKCYGNHEARLGVIDLSTRPPMKHTQLMSVDMMSEITSYSPSLLSPIVAAKMLENEVGDSST